MSSADSAEQQLTMTLEAGGIIRMISNSSVAITAPLARQASAAVDKLCRDTPRLILVDLAHIASVDRPARSLFGESSKPSRVALFGSSQVDRTIANFMLRMHKSPNPIKFFADETAAVAWLKGGSNGSRADDRHLS